MTKAKTIVSLIVLLALLSFSPTDVKTGTKKGDKFGATAEIESALQSGNGMFVLVNFWASYDAQSRMENIRFARLADRYGKKQFEQAAGLAVLSLSMDEFQSIFVETVKRDSLSGVTNILVKEGFGSELAKNCKLSGQCGNFLLDAHGVITLNHCFSPPQLLIFL